jgi:thioredoxin reductase
VTTSPADSVFDVAVVGAGPAGMAAAAAAADAGARVALIDAAPRPGGQFWRHRPDDDGARHHAWATFTALRECLERAAGDGRVVTLAGNSVWYAERADDAFVIHALCDGAERQVRARTVVIATGAYDRQVPFPGWTLPGVMTAGAAQALLKGHGVVAGRRIAVAGSGPFLLPVAAGLADAGARLVGVFEAGRPTAFARHPRVALRSLATLREGAGYLATLARHGTRYRTRTAVVSAVGSDELTGVRVASVDDEWRVRPGSEREIACDTLAVGYGFTAQTELPVALGCEMVADADGGLVARAGPDQRTSVPGVYVAGEACGIGGATLALAEGEIAGHCAAGEASGRSPDAQALDDPVRRRARGRAFAAVLQAAFPVRAGWQGWLAPDTILCRCEEVTIADLRHATGDLGAADPRSAKLLARPGMGLCQGRVCGYATACLVAAAGDRDVTADDLRGIAGRPIAQPVPLGVLAGLGAPGDDGAM